MNASLDRSRWDAARGRRPATRLVDGPPQRVWDVLSRLLSGVEREYWGLDDASFLVEAAVPESIVARGPRSLLPLIARGVPVHQVTTRASLAADADLGTILWRVGGRARVVEKLPMKACVLDQRLAVVPTDLSVLAHGFVVSRDPAFVRMVASQHRSLWGSGARLDGADAASPPPADLAPVLWTLLEGVSDEAAARRLGVSGRTYSRRVAALLAALGVRSRFAAGAEAARRGWV